MFLKQVKLSHFAVSRKGSPKFYSNGARRRGRHVDRVENKSPDDVYTIVGQSHLYDGTTVWNGGDEPNGFDIEKRYTVFIVAKSIGRSFKVLVEDITVLEE